jgi:hypothetical protein
VAIQEENFSETRKNQRIAQAYDDIHIGSDVQAEAGKEPMVRRVAQPESRQQYNPVRPLLLDALSQFGDHIRVD